MDSKDDKEPRGLDCYFNNSGQTIFDELINSSNSNEEEETTGT